MCATEGKHPLHSLYTASRWLGLYMSARKKQLANQNILQVVRSTYEHLKKNTIFLKEEEKFKLNT